MAVVGQGEARHCVDQIAKRGRAQRPMLLSGLNGKSRKTWDGKTIKLAGLDVYNNRGILWGEGSKKTESCFSEERGKGKKVEAEAVQLAPRRNTISSPG